MVQPGPVAQRRHRLIELIPGQLLQQPADRRRVPLDAEFLGQPPAAEHLLAVPGQLHVQQPGQAGQRVIGVEGGVGHGQCTGQILNPPGRPGTGSPTPARAPADARPAPVSADWVPHRLSHRQRTARSPAQSDQEQGLAASRFPVRQPLDAKSAARRTIFASRESVSVSLGHQGATRVDRPAPIGLPTHVTRDPTRASTAGSRLYGGPMASVKQIQVTFDCAEPERVARCWCEVLG